MGFIIFIKILILQLYHLPHFLYLHFKDRVHWYLIKGWEIFDYWGLHLYVGKFGAGKTSTMVYDAYKIAKAFPSVSIVTNLKLMNFPEHTKILPLKSPQDILHAPKNTLVVIDEIGTIFNSRDFAKSKESVPKILFQHLCQCRKRHMMIYATTQRWNFLDKQLRDIVATVRSTRMTFRHPFSRMGIVKKYDAVEYDLWFSNPMVKLEPFDGSVYIQTDKIRGLYDTAELIESMLDKEYISDAEILENQGYGNVTLTEISKEGQKTIRGQRKR